MKKYLFKMKVLVMCMCLFVMAVAAHAAVAIPEVLGVGVSVSDYLSAALLLMGGVVGVAVGGYFGFFVIRAAFSWARVALGGR